MTRFFAACTTQGAVGCVVAPRTRIRRLAYSITASTRRYQRPSGSPTRSGRPLSPPGPAAHRERADTLSRHMTAQPGSRTGGAPDVVTRIDTESTDPIIEQRTLNPLDPSCRSARHRLPRSLKNPDQRAGVSSGPSGSPRQAPSAAMSSLLPWRQRRDAARGRMSLARYHLLCHQRIHHRLLGIGVLLLVPQDHVHRDGGGIALLRQRPDIMGRRGQIVVA
jgi:hypothetical protein